jgi:hypothetical protein
LKQDLKPSGKRVNNYRCDRLLLKLFEFLTRIEPDLVSLFTFEFNLHLIFPRFTVCDCERVHQGNYTDLRVFGSGRTIPRRSRSCQCASTSPRFRKTLMFGFTTSSRDMESYIFSVLVEDMQLHPKQFHLPETRPFTFIVHHRALSAHIPEAHCDSAPFC